MKKSDVEIDFDLRLKAPSKPKPTTSQEEEFILNQEEYGKVLVRSKKLGFKEHEQDGYHFFYGENLPKDEYPFILAKRESDKYEELEGGVVDENDNKVDFEFTDGDDEKKLSLDLNTSEITIESIKENNNFPISAQQIQNGDLKERFLFMWAVSPKKLANAFYQWFPDVKTKKDVEWIAECAEKGLDKNNLKVSFENILDSIQVTEHEVNKALQSVQFI